MALVKAPRSAFVNFPLGHNCGKPHDVDMQTRILKDTLNVLVTATTPGDMVHLPYEWENPFDWNSFQRDTQEMLQEEGSTAQEWKPKQ